MPQTRQQLVDTLASLHPACTRWSLVCTHYDRDLAEEVLQTAYLKVLDGRAKFGGRSSFRTWVFGIVRLTALELAREPPLLMPVTDDDETHPVCEPERPSLTEAIARLSPMQRQIAYLVFYEDETLEVSARILGVTVGNIRQQYHRLKDRLRHLVTEAEQDIELPHAAPESGGHRDVT